MTQLPKHTPNSSKLIWELGVGSWGLGNVDLMERLRQSLQAAGTGARKTARGRKTTARAASRKKKKAA